MISAPRMSELYWEPTRGGRVPFGVEGLIGGAYMAVGHSEQWIECCRAQLARGRDTRGITRAALVVALAITGSRDEAMAAANGLIDDAEATDNPLALSWALLTYGTAFQDSDPDRARHNLRRGLAIAQDSDNRYNETNLAATLCRFEDEVLFGHIAPPADATRTTGCWRDRHDNWTRGFHGTQRAVDDVSGTVGIFGTQSSNGRVTTRHVRVHTIVAFDAAGARRLAAAIPLASDEPPLEQDERDGQQHDRHRQ